MHDLSDDVGLMPPDGAHPKALSRREQEVLEMVATGRTNGEIARQLEITVHAVKFHLASVYRKLGVANRTEAAVAHLTAKRVATNGATAGQE